MAKLQPTDDILKARTKANIKKYLVQIKEKIVAQSKKEGHNISVKNVKSVTFKKLKDVTYEIFSITFGKFVITDPKDFVWLDGMTWVNNSPGPARRNLKVNESTEDTYNWQITAGFTYQYEQKEEFKIYAPAGGSITSSFKFSFDFHASYGQASTKTHGWVNDFEQVIPANTVVRMEVKGIQFVGYVPFKIKARTSGKAECECIVDYWGKHTRTFNIDLPRILNDKERTFVSEGKVDGVQGYDWNVQSFTPAELTAQQRKQLPQGVTEQHLFPKTLDLSKLKKK
jgi:hypothetical protein